MKNKFKSSLVGICIATQLALSTKGFAAGEGAGADPLSQLIGLHLAFTTTPIPGWLILTTEGTITTSTGVALAATTTTATTVGGTFTTTFNVTSDGNFKDQDGNEVNLHDALDDWGNENGSHIQKSKHHFGQALKLFFRSSKQNKERDQKKKAKADEKRAKKDAKHSVPIASCTEKERTDASLTVECKLENHTQEEEEMIVEEAPGDIAQPQNESESSTSSLNTSERISEVD